MNEKEVNDRDLKPPRSFNDRRSLGISLAILVLVLAVLAVVVPDALNMRTQDVVKKGAGVTKIVKLSSYFDGIAGTRGDTDI